MKKIAILVVFGFLITGCQSTFGPEIGMSEKQWLRRTLIADVVYQEGSVKAYRSSGRYFYFVDGILQRIDQGVIPAQRIQLEVNTRGSQKVQNVPSRYDELERLNELKQKGVLTEEEFQAEKQKILNSN
jgi:predicted acyltransferase (DUF342 family)